MPSLSDLAADYLQSCPAVKYSCMYSKHKARKNKNRIWQDGLLVISKERLIILYDEEDPGKKIESHRVNPRTWAADLEILDMPLHVLNLEEATFLGPCKPDGAPQSSSRVTHKTHKVSIIPRPASDQRPEHQEPLEPVTTAGGWLHVTPGTTQKNSPTPTDATTESGAPCESTSSQREDDTAMHMQDGLHPSEKHVSFKVDSINLVTEPSPEDLAEVGCKYPERQPRKKRKREEILGLFSTEPST